MKIYMGFVAALDTSGENISHRLSEVDVSNPEDVKAILPDPVSGAFEPSSGSADVLVHFGDGKYLERYREYEQHLAEWRAQYPKLASVDLRYERQVVLQMQPGATATASDAAASAVGAAAPASASGESSSTVNAESAAQKTAAAPMAAAAATKSKGKPAAKRAANKPSASLQGDAR